MDSLCTSLEERAQSLISRMANVELMSFPSTFLMLFGVPSHGAATAAQTAVGDEITLEG